jgi:hypothetical protein
MLDVARNGTSRAIQLLAGNKGVNVDVIRAIYANLPNDAIKLQLARNHATPSDIIYILGQSEKWRIKNYAVLNMNAPLDLLEENSFRSFYDRVCVRGPYKGWRGSINRYPAFLEQIVMLHHAFPIQLFAESIAFVSSPASSYKLYRARGQELVDYLNAQYSLNLDYKDTAGIVRAVMAHLPHP